jgi:hypothetical protein
MNRPSNLYEAERLTEYAGGAKIWMKYVSSAPVRGILSGTYIPCFTQARRLEPHRFA